MLRTTTIEEAFSHVTDGARIYIQGGAATPTALVAGLAARALDLRDVTTMSLHLEGPAPHVAPEFTGRIRHNAFFIGRNVREAVREGRADYTPVFLSDIPALFTRGVLPVDVALLQVSPPDEHGYCSLGVSVDVAQPAALAARHVIALVNPQMPRTFGDSLVHVDRVDSVIEYDGPLHESAEPAATEVADAIGRNVASLIDDGMTLQLGIGSVSAAVLRALRDHRDLGIHSEMFTEGVVDLVERGVITGARKRLHPGQIVASFATGTRRLYDFVDRNPAVEMHPSHYTNDPWVIAQHDGMVAVNSAIEVDLSGQVCADSVAGKFYSGIGGQVDFIRGAARADRGRPIIALPSTAADGAISRIVSRLESGAGVVTTRGDVHYVVTEFGVADLHGRTVRERAQRLIRVAAPQFRERLAREAADLYGFRLSSG
jgi:acyl-CoA hydrolase